MWPTCFRARHARLLRLVAALANRRTVLRAVWRLRFRRGGQEPRRPDQSRPQRRPGGSAIERHSAVPVRRGDGNNWGIENTGSHSQDLIFDHTINGGQLRLFDPSGSFLDLQSTVAVSIFTLAPDVSGFVWEWGVSLRGTAPGVGRDDLSDEAVVDIAPFTATVNLGEMSPGALATITYDMFGQVSGPGLRFSGGTATVGDPFDLSGKPGSVLSFKGDAATVPEPASLALLGAGLAVLLRRQRCRWPASMIRPTPSSRSVSSICE